MRIKPTLLKRVLDIKLNNTPRTNDPQVFASQAIDYFQKIKRLISPEKNMWNRMKTDATISTTNPCSVSHKDGPVQNVFGIKAFRLNKIDNFPGTNIYYYEVKIVTPAQN
jgi:hypothetical protein